MNVKAVYEGLTPKGRKLMELVGKQAFSFFDDGIVEGSGIWGTCLAEEGWSKVGVKSVKGMSGVMVATKSAGLWTSHEDDNEAGAGEWWALTALGAAVATYAAAPVASTWDKDATIGANAKALRAAGFAWRAIGHEAYLAGATADYDRTKGSYAWADRMAAAAKKEG